MRGGGAERVMSILCHEFVQKRYEVYLATNTQIPFAYQIDKKTNIISLYPEDYFRSSSLKRNYKFYSSVRRIAANIRPDIIISFIHNVCAATWGLSIPVIQSEHTTFTRKLSLKFDFERRYVNLLAAKVTILTNSDYSFLGKNLPNKVVMPNPLTFPISSTEEKRNKTILAVGRIDMWKVKGFDSLIKAWAVIASRYKDWHLEIAGIGSDENVNHLKQLSQDLNVECSVRFLGFKTNIDEIMRKSEIFVLSSRVEGFSMVLIEAMSQGCACVSFDCNNGPREIITHNKSGLLVENQNIEELSITMARLIDDKEMRRYLSANAKFEMQKYTTDNIIAKWENLFTEIFNKDD